jgi:ABC-type bacteriocin/lantibiotic exporter with double-glycine peptidase domain
MKSNTLVIDLAFAVAVAVIVLIVSPGLAITGIIAIFVLLVCGISYVFDARRAGSRRTRPPRRSSRGG